MFEFLPHTADARIRLEAADFAGLLAEAARALAAALVERPDSIRTGQTVQIAVGWDPESDREDVLFDWLCELLYRFDTEHFVPALVAALDASPEEGVRATLRGEAFDDARHGQNMDIKAITYHGLFVQSTDTGMVAEVIVDL